MLFLLLIAHGILPGLSAAQPVDGYLVVLADCTAEWVCLDHKPTVGFVKLRVYDVLGRKRATLVTGFFRAGRYLVIWDGAGAPDGVYFYRLQAAGTAITRSMVRGR